jgi:hypothetical protein
LNLPALSDVVALIVGQAILLVAAYLPGALINNRTASTTAPRWSTGEPVWNLVAAK